MKRILAVAACISVSISLVSCLQRQEIKNSDNPGSTLVCFGDSITFGYGVSPEESYPAHLAGMLAVPVINTGIDAETSSEALLRIDSDVLSRDPFLVIIEFGGNDFLRKVPLEVTASNINAIIDRIQGYGAMVALVDISTDLVLTEYHAIFRSIARKKGVIFIPRVFSGIITNPELKSDFIHPNAMGYKMIATRVFKAISPYLKTSGEKPKH